MRRKSIRISFDAFMAKSRPGLENTSGDEFIMDKENQVKTEKQQMIERAQAKQFGNVRKRNNSWSDKRVNTTTSKQKCQRKYSVGKLTLKKTMTV